MQAPDAAQTPAPVILIDGSSYLFRAYHAMPPLTNRAGHPTGAIKGVINMVRAMISQYPDSAIAVVFDTKGPTFRNEIYADYKANRPPMPEDLAPQIQPIHEIIQTLGLPLLAVDGVEADDVIGTLAADATRTGRACIISTGDKDMAQLVSSHVTLVNTMNNEWLDTSGVQEKYGFGPELIIDYLALMGDKSDNIPGVPGVGEKTAKALLTGLGGVDTLYSRLQDIPELGFRGAKTLPAKLEKHEELARLSYDLATIRCDLELPVTLADLAHRPADTVRLAELYREFEFNAWLKELGEAASASLATDPTNTNSDTTASAEEAVSDHPDTLDYQMLRRPEEWQRWLAQTPADARFSLWPVTSGGHYRAAMQPGDCLGLAVSTQAGVSVYLDFQADTWPRAALEPLTDFFTRYSFPKNGYHLKKLRHVLTSHGLTEPSNLNQDALLMAFVLDATLRRHPDIDRHLEPLSLDNLALHYLGTAPTSWIDLAGPPGARQTAAHDLPVDQVAAYANARADYCGRLVGWFTQRLRATSADLWRVYEHIERPLIPVLQQVEWTGVQVDSGRLGQLSAQFRSELDGLEQQAHALADTQFNLDSPRQLGDVLFNRLGLPVVAKTPSGQPSTNEEVLSELAATYELPALILRYRHLRKLLTTYTDPLPELIHPETGRVHTSYHQTGAQTGRLSSTEPNLQNIPIRSSEGRSIRQAFIGESGRRIVAADYSQIELRIMTHLSADPNLVQAFQSGQDIHRATASEILGVATDRVTPEQRRAAKAVNFGLIYGMSAFGLARNLGISRSEAKSYVDTYFARYPGVREYMDKTRAEAAEAGYVETVFGRRLYLPDIRSSRQQVRRAAERTAINAPMQGTAADIIKMAMVDVQTWLSRSDLDARLVMQVHDELVIEAAANDLDAVIKGVRLRMETVAALSVPLVVDVGVGSNWDQAH